VNHSPGADFPVLRGTITIRNPRSVLLLQPFQFCLAFALWLTAIVFTIWPEALEHAPVSFEQRGIVHHVWHYALLLGTSVLMCGMLSAGRRRLQAELIGLFLLIGCLGLNLTAVLADTVGLHESIVSGLGIAIRAGFLAALLIRVYIVIAEPTVDLNQGGE
jgi:hypothetical protein